MHLRFCVKFDGVTAAAARLCAVVGLAFMATPGAAAESFDALKNRYRQLDELRMECATGDGEACYELGRAYETRKDIWGFPIGGDGVRRDDGKAARYFFLSCEDGVRAACRDLGRLYETGKGVARDQAAAARFYRKACGLRDGGKCEGA